MSNTAYYTSSVKNLVGNFFESLIVSKSSMKPKEGQGQAVKESYKQSWSCQWLVCILEDSRQSRFSCFKIYFLPSNYVVSKMS